MFEIGDWVINYWGIITAAIASVVVGSLWYGPLFGKIWMRESGVQKPEVMTPEAKSSMKRGYIITLVAALTTAFIVDHFVGVIGVGTGAWYIFAFLLWLGFIVPTYALNSVLWEGKSIKLYWINVFYYLVMLELYALIFVFWPF